MTLVDLRGEGGDLSCQYLDLRLGEGDEQPCDQSGEDQQDRFALLHQRRADQVSRGDDADVGSDKEEAESCDDGKRAEGERADGSPSDRCDREVQQYDNQDDRYDGQGCFPEFSQQIHTTTPCKAIGMSEHTDNSATRQAQLSVDISQNPVIYS